MKKIFILSAGFLFLTSFIFNLLQSHKTSIPELSRETTVSSLLNKYGVPVAIHDIASVDLGKVKMGEEIVKKGSTTLPSGEKTTRIANYFVCTDCHNVVREANAFQDSNPYQRLDYMKANGIEYLAASTFFGIYNRESWFNGDYSKKYGEQALTARNNLKNAIQLCSEKCFSGRPMNELELESVLHYFASLQLKLSDLALTDGEWERLNHFEDNGNYKKEMISLLKSKYITAYPGTFATIIPVDKRKLGEDGNAEYGEIIFEKGCMHCHKEGGLAKTVFTYQGKNAAWLISYFLKDNGGSIYNITRTGTESSKKTPQYMPVFTKEKLTDSMLEDLAAYLNKKRATEQSGK